MWHHQKMMDCLLSLHWLICLLARWKSNSDCIQLMPKSTIVAGRSVVHATGELAQQPPPPAKNDGLVTEQRLTLWDFVRMGLLIPVFMNSVGERSLVYGRLRWEGFGGACRRLSWCYDLPVLGGGLGKWRDSGVAKPGVYKNPRQAIYRRRNNLD